MSAYVTEQRRELMSFFKENPDKYFCAKDVARLLKNSNISLSAIYRNLSRLEQDGYIARSIKEGTRESFYRWLEFENCRDCIHLSCTKCGDTFHMNKKASCDLLTTVSQKDGFFINRKKTVLYGICGKCGGENEK